MASVWDASSDSFYITLSSDACSNLYPENSPGEFRVQLNHSMMLDPNEWSVGLSSMHYVYGFPNIDEETFLLVYHKGVVRKVTLPKWHCSGLEDLAHFLRECIDQALLLISNNFNEIGSSTGIQVWVSLDPLKRVKIVSSSTDFDIGFSPALLELLGLNVNSRFSLKMFSRRVCTHRAWLSLVQRHAELAEARSRAKTRAEGAKEKKGDVAGASEKNKEETVNDRSVLAFSDLRELMKRTFSNTYGGLFTKTADLEGIKKKIQKHVGTDHRVILEALRQAFREEMNSPTSLVAQYLSKEPKSWPWNTSEFDPDEMKDFAKFLDTCERAMKIPKDERSVHTVYAEDWTKTSVAYELLIVMFFLSDMYFKAMRDDVVLGEVAGFMNPFELIYVYTDIIRSEAFNDDMTRILTTIQTEGSVGQMSTYRPNTVQYKNLDRSDLSNIKVLIVSDSGKPVPFQRGPVVITLHFVRKGGRHPNF
jgi:hypothetical protein